MSTVARSIADDPHRPFHGMKVGEWRPPEVVSQFAFSPDEILLTSERNCSSSTFCFAKRWSQKATTIQVQAVDRTPTQGPHTPNACPARIVDVHAHNLPHMKLLQ